jgi:hypothetical protein
MPCTFRGALRGTGARATAATLTMLLLASTVPTPVAAQSSPGGAAPITVARPSARMLRTSIFGALTGSVLATGYYFLSEKGTRSNGCQPINCALPFLVTSGGLAGMFVGRELDAQRRAFAPRAGSAIAFGFAEVGVLSSPTFIDVRDTLIAVVSDSGAQLLSATASPKALRRRASGLSAMRQIAIMPSRGTLLLGTGSALWEAGLLTGPASRLADGAVDALAVSPDAILSASGRRVRLRTGTGETARTDSMDLPRPVSAIAYDATAGSWWVATDSQVVQMTGREGKLATSSVSMPLPAAARAIAVSAGWVAAALGDEGVIAWARESLSSSPTPVRVTQEPRFAYDLAFLGESLFVAGGVDGLFQLSLTPVARVIGSSRQLQFATTVRAGNGVLWVGDRNRQSVVRVTP